MAKLVAIQFSQESHYDIDIDMRNDNNFINLKFHELDVLLLLKDINPSKAAGPAFMVWYLKIALSRVPRKWCHLRMTWH